LPILLAAIFPKFLHVCDCDFCNLERATQLRKVPRNSGKQFNHHRTTQQGTGEKRPGKKRLKGDGISFEALLANTANKPAGICGTRKPQARMTPADFEAMMRQVVDMLEEAVSSKLMMPDDLQAVMYTLGGASPNDRLSDSNAPSKNSE
jgi:hypothetical protein